MREFEDKFVQMVNVYNKLNDMNIEYVPGFEISHLDAHLLNLMSKNPDKKASELAELFGVTKGAVSQQVKKLEKRDLVTRVRHNDNFREVYIQLTENGKKAVKAHDEFHEIMFAELEASFENITDEQKLFFNSILDNLTALFIKAEDVIKKKA